jgi:hypothetical protein
MHGSNFLVFVNKEDVLTEIVVNYPDAVEIAPTNNQDALLESKSQSTTFELWHYTNPNVPELWIVNTVVPGESEA